MLKKKVYEYEIIIFTIYSAQKASPQRQASKRRSVNTAAFDRMYYVVLVECITEADSLKTNINIITISSRVLYDEGLCQKGQGHNQGHGLTKSQGHDHQCHKQNSILLQANS